ncbi:MAG: fumarylacetoacetate hydrolase family protein [Litorilinea sp.]
MFLTRHVDAQGARWAKDGQYLPAGFSLAALLALPRRAALALLESLPGEGTVDAGLLAPVEPSLEVWGCGVTYLRSREARKAESATADVYQKVYDAERPEIFFKSAGWRTVGHGEDVRIRKDTRWNVPEPEATLVINAYGEILGYTIGNDMSSRDIEGENPLYLPQAKTYTGSCAVGPGIVIAADADLDALSVRMEIERDGAIVFEGDTGTDQMKRTFADLVAYLYRELSFPHGALLMTGTGIVPPDDFTLQRGDVIRIHIAQHTLENRVA